MIKIIKEGIKPKKYKYIYSYTCTNCTCEFEFEEPDCTDIQKEKCFDGRTSGYIKCPTCDDNTYFIDIKQFKHREEEIIEESINLGDHAINIDDIYQWSHSLCKCPKCGGTNTLRNDSIVLTTWPVQYNFKCRDCGHRWTGFEPTLINPKVYDPWDNEHCNGCPSRNQIGDTCSFCSHSPYRVTYSNEVKNNE